MKPIMIAKIFDSGFPLGHDTYNGMKAASDGRIYYVLCSEGHDTGGQMYAHDPANGAVTHCGDLTAMCGEAGKRAVCQGKSHVNFVESDGRLYFATHTGYYAIIDGMEKQGVPPEGWTKYPGGHLLSYDTRTGAVEDLATEPGGDGILTMNMDSARGRIYGLTWPEGRFFRFDVATRDWRDFGGFFEHGEHGVGGAYRTVCRSLAADPRDGSVYFTRGEGTVFAYRFDCDSVVELEGSPMRKDYFGLYDVASPGHMAYNWRQVVWHPREEVFYGVHGNSGYLFRYDPAANEVEVIERISSEPSRRSGMLDQFSYGYLGFDLGPCGETLYYLTGGPIYRDGRRVAGKASTAKGESKGEENLHLVTYHIPSRGYRDHGAIFFEDGSHPAYVNSIAVGKDGTVYTLSRLRRGGGEVADLIAMTPGAID